MSALNKPEYDFLKTNPLLGDNIILLGYGGSIAYGTNLPTSDVDIRGIATRSAYDILAAKRFDQVIDNTTDTTVYSIEKIFNLLSNCNPNVIELLGLKPEHYLKLTTPGKLILQNRKLFLSQRAAKSFGGYAWAQLHRLTNKTYREEVRFADPAKLAKHQMHLMRLFLMAYDILEKEEIITYREADRDFLLEIRSGKYLDKFNHPTDEFMSIVDKANDKLFKDVSETSLPPRPDMKKIEDLLYTINKEIVKNAFKG